ncbi:CbtA family protein [Paracoccus sp. (in: a-proteobacteria)]|uniref:CbtA family protein n=1 Tax=Paracoccus sp. TaxID=267 RepID=UPI002899B257|nr:CbtA family protein [Paracoccus sp. (in: a-proteobacteria)]
MDIKSISSALIAGAAAGLIAALLQLWLVQPVLLHAELYEGGERTHFSAPPEEGHSHSHDSAAIAPDDHAHDQSASTPSPHQGDAPFSAEIDLKRDALTVLFSILIYAGYALLSLAVLLATTANGRKFAVRDGILWGLGGFLAVQFLPAIGLAPELPGMSAADLTQRQIWWGATVAASALGIWLIAFGRNWLSWGLAILLIAAPHVIGAPHIEVFTGPAPPELASEFASRALGVGLVGWLVMGLALFALLFSPPRRIQVQ